MEPGDLDKMSDNDDKKQLTIVDAIANNKELATTEDKKVPLSMVFGHGTLGNIESFGGKSLMENSQRLTRLSQTLVS